MHLAVSMVARWFWLLALPLVVPEMHAQPRPAGQEIVRSGEDVRVRTKQGLFISANALGLSGDSLRLARPYYSPSVIALADIDRLWAHRGYHTVKGAALGTGLGVAAGVLLGALVGEQGDLRQGDMILGGSLTLGAAGLISGVIAGGLTERWVRIRFR